MIRYAILITSIAFAIAAYGCNEDYGNTIEINPLESNLEINKGIEAKSSWTKTPESIAKHLFPSVTHEEGNNFYKVEAKQLSNSSYKVTVTNEGVIDDEINGVKIIIDFKLMEGKWNISDIHKSYKYEDR